MPKPIKSTLLEKERHILKTKSGGGQLSYEVWGYEDKNGETVITRYNLAYINPLIYAKDNGRVLGFDNAHNYHHRHFMGKVEKVEYVSYEDTVDRFQQELDSLINSIKGKKS